MFSPINRHGLIEYLTLYEPILMLYHRCDVHITQLFVVTIITNQLALIMNINTIILRQIKQVIRRPTIYLVIIQKHVLDC